jgi:hypothetical protein
MILRLLYPTLVLTTLITSTIASGCSSSDCDVPEGFDLFCERFGDYCDCGLKPVDGTGGTRVDTCDARQFVGGNCCFHPNTISCRCDGVPVCTDNGTVLGSCSDAFADAC